MNLSLVGSKVKPVTVPVVSEGGESTIELPDAVVVTNYSEAHGWLSLQVRRDDPHDKSVYPGRFVSTNFQPA